LRLEGEYVFNGPREVVWELVRDPEALGAALPGAQRMSKISDEEYEGEMNVRIGPVAGLFAGRVIVSDQAPPEGYTLSVEGKGAPGFASGTGRVQLIDQDVGTTRMRYEGELHVGGRLASVGQRLLDATAKSIVRQGLESLDAALQARMAAQADGVQVEYTPPTEAEFAAAVARDMAGEVLRPARRKPWIIAALAVVALGLGIWWLGKGGVRTNT